MRRYDIDHADTTEPDAMESGIMQFLIEMLDMTEGVAAEALSLLGDWIDLDDPLQFAELLG